MRADRVWITRTEPGATKLATELRKRGYECWVEPLIEIHPIASLHPSSTYECVIYLSTHAVHHAPHRYQGSAITLAIGEGTAAALRDYEVVARVPQKHSSEGLLELIQADYSSLDTILLICGRNSRSMLLKTLRERDQQVDPLEVYERRLRPKIETSQMFRERVVVLIESLETLNALIQLIAQQDPQIAQAWDLVVPSERIAREARQHSQFKVRVSNGISLECTLNTLAKVT